MVGNTISDVLGSLERERRTGLLRVGGDGTVHVDRGAVVHAESPHAPGPRPGGADPELRRCSRCSTPPTSSSAPRPSRCSPRGRRAGVPSGSPWRRSCTSGAAPRPPRRRLAGRGVDAAPVVPVRRVRRQRVILTGVQAEILLNADGGAPPAAGPRPRPDGVRLPARGPRPRRRVPDPDGPARRPRPPPPPRAEIPAEWAPADHDLLGRLRAALVELG